MMDTMSMSLDMYLTPIFHTITGDNNLIRTKSGTCMYLWILTVLLTVEPSPTIELKYHLLNPTIDSQQNISSY